MIISMMKLILFVIVARIIAIASGNCESETTSFQDHECGSTSAFTNPSSCTSSNTRETTEINDNVDLTLKPLPKTLLGLKYEYNNGLKENSPRMELIKHVWNSRQIGRSFSRASILILGSTGVGKSSTLNHFFGRKIASINDKKSETRYTTEYIIKGDRPTYGVKDLELGLIDSPGFGDTDGVAQDACNIFSIKKFFRDHPELGGYKPNLIFLLVKATDDRISGPNSAFAKLLKGLNTLKLVDEKYPNVVGILTWSCSLPKRKWDQKIEDKKNVMQNMIYNYLHISAPIVAIENAFEDHDLEIYGDYSKLPNGILQPKNIYDACKRLLRDSKDHFGLIILNACFANAIIDMSSKPVVGFQVAAKDSSKIELAVEEEKIRIFIEKASRGGLENLFVQKAENFINKEDVSVLEIDDIQRIVTNLKKIQVKDKEDLQYIRVGHITSGKPLSDKIKKFLEELPVKSEPVAIESSRVIGQGYNARIDKVVAAQIFEIDLIDSGYGISIPSLAKLEKVIESRDHMVEYRNHAEMVKSRLKQLNIDVHVFSSILDFEPRSGGNVNTVSYFWQPSFLREERLFEIKMVNFDDDNKLRFTNTFTSAVRKLPLLYKKNDAENRSLYKKFFEKWGQFIVVSAYCGGSIELRMNSKLFKGRQLSFDDIKIGMSSLFSFGWTQKEKEEINYKDILKDCTVHWNGGDRDLFDKTTLEDSDSMRKWRLSSMERPTMLESEMSLEPISTVVGVINKIKGDSTLKAIEDYLGVKFKKKSEEKKEKVIESTKRYETPTDPPKSKSTCFPSSAKVTVLQENKVLEKYIIDISVGDLVMVRNINSKNKMFSPVIMFAHYNNSRKAEYLNIVLENSKHITLSRNHLLIVGSKETSVMAEEIKVGDMLYDKIYGLVKVVEIKQVFEQGIFAPITYDGTIFINDILASCYASINNYIFFNGIYQISGHELAHLGLLPMRWWHKLFAKKNIFEKNKVDNEIIPEMHPYIQNLVNLDLPCMAKL